MAVDDSGKQARLLPCLAILRYTVATVVTVLAVVVIVMVISVGVRPDDVSVSVVQGHVRTSDLYNVTTTYVRRGNCIAGRGAQNSELISSCFGGTDDDFNFGAGGIDGRPLTRTVYMYTRVDNLNLDVILSVDNPSGRASIFCENITVSFHAGGGPSTAAGMEIGAFKLDPNLDFHVKPQTSHKIGRSMRVPNTTVLDYIANTYGGESSFTGTVEVTMNTSSVVTLGHHTTPSSIVKFVCSPVDFSVGYVTATAPSVQCSIKSD